MSLVKTRGASLLALLVLAGCGSRQTPGEVRALQEWDPALARFFDDAADFISDPNDLEGNWATEYAGDLQGRVDAADVICRIRVETIREDIAIDGRRRKHLLASVTSVLRGEPPPEDRVHLVVGEGVAGFDTIDRYERRLLDNRFVAFIRWYDTEDGAVQAHWHISPASEPVVALVRDAITQRGQATTPAE